MNSLDIIDPGDGMIDAALGSPPPTTTMQSAVASAAEIALGGNPRGFVKLAEAASAIGLDIPRRHHARAIGDALSEHGEAIDDVARGGELAACEGIDAVVGDACGCLAAVVRGGADVAMLGRFAGAMAEVARSDGLCASYMVVGSVLLDVAMVEFFGREQADE